MKLKAITHFDNNVKPVLTTMSQIMKRIIAPLSITDQMAKFKQYAQMITLASITDVVVQSIQNCAKEARQFVWDCHVFGDKKDNMVKHNVFVNEEMAIEAYWEKDDHPLTGDFLKERSYTSQTAINKEMK